MGVLDSSSDLTTQKPNHPTCPVKEHNDCCTCKSDEYPGDWDNGKCCGHCTSVCDEKLEANIENCRASFEARTQSFSLAGCCWEDYHCSQGESCYRGADPEVPGLCEVLDSSSDLTTQKPKMETLRLVAQVEGVTEDNKDATCSSFGSALSGTVTHCSLAGASTGRRQLNAVPLYMDIQVSDFEASQAAVEADDFTTSLTLPDSVTVFSVDVSDGVNGKEYCESDDMINNEDACKSSSCCHWNTSEEGEASFNGKGRCWSSIDQEICSDKTDGKQLNEEDNESSFNTPLVIGIVGGVVFIAAIAIFISHQKLKSQKPTPDMNQIGTMVV